MLLNWSWQLRSPTPLWKSRYYITNSIHLTGPVPSLLCDPPDHVAWHITFLSSLPPQTLAQRTQHLAINIFCPQHSCYHNQGLVCPADCVLCHDIVTVRSLLWTKWTLLLCLHGKSRFLSERKHCVQEEKTAALLFFTSKDSHWNLDGILPHKTTLHSVRMPSACTGSIHEDYQAETGVLVCETPE